MRALRITIATVLLAISFGCGSSNSPSTPSPTPSPTPTPSPGLGVTASIVTGARLLTTTAYTPNPIVASVGGTVTWTNNDTINHTSTADGGAWSSGTIAPGGSFSTTFSARGTFPYHCAIHPGMIGTVTVQ